MRWYPTKAQAVAAFERASKRAGIAAPERYPPSVSGDCVTHNDIAYPRHSRAAGMRDGHGWVYVDARNDVLLRYPEPDFWGIDVTSPNRA